MITTTTTTPPRNLNVGALFILLFGGIFRLFL
nr:MAG TPA: hypothetical protein [Caudoviricetes sp.]